MGSAVRWRFAAGSDEEGGGGGHAGIWAATGRHGCMLSAVWREGWKPEVGTDVREGEALQHE